MPLMPEAHYAAISLHGCRHGFRRANFSQPAPHAGYIARYASVYMSGQQYFAREGFAFRWAFTPRRAHAKLLVFYFLAGLRLHAEHAFAPCHFATTPSALTGRLARVNSFDARPMRRFTALGYELSQHMVLHVDDVLPAQAYIYASLSIRAGGDRVFPPQPAH